jgi:hypothetical protein
VDCAFSAALASGAAAPKACALLTQAQVSAAVDSNVTSGEPMGVNSCNWQTSAGGKAAEHVTVTLRVEGAKAFADARARPVPGVPREAASGIGDDAFFDQLGNLAALAVKRGNSSFWLRVYGVRDISRQRSIETTLAKNVAAKL